MVNERFWTGVAVAGCVLAGLVIFWPALERIARGQWLAGALVAIGTGVILTMIWLQNRR